MRGEPASCGTQPQYSEGAERAFNMFTKYLIECGGLSGSSKQMVEALMHNFFSIRNPVCRATEISTAARDSQEMLFIILSPSLPL